jgi:hypothetical protein
MIYECEICNTGRRLREVAGKLNEDDARWLLDLGANLAAVQMDCKYWESIMQGDWPGSVEILERALRRAKEK